MVVVVLGGALLITKRVADDAADTSIAKALAATESSIDNELASRSHGLARVTERLAAVPNYVSRVSEAILAGNRADLLDQAEEFRDQTGAEWALITDPDGVLQAWTLNRDQYGDSLGTGSLVGLALEGNSTEGTWIEPGEEGDRLYQAVGAPIQVRSPGGGVTLYGVLVTAVPIDSGFAALLKRNTNSEIVFFERDSTGQPRTVIATVPRAAVDSAIQSINPDSAFVEADGMAGDSAAAPVLIRMNTGDQRWVGRVGALRTADDFPIGGYVGLRSRDVELAPYTRLRQVVTGAFIAGIILTLISSLLIARQITRPVKRLVELTRQVSEGQYSGAIDVHSRDEIGQLADSFRRMMDELREKDRIVEYLSAAGGQTVPLAITLPQPGSSRAGTPTPSGMFPLGAVLANRYELKEILGTGGMGVVYKAVDRELGEVVALKTLKGELMQHDVTQLERFKQEIRLARRITHRNVVRTHDLGEVDGIYFITMEFVEGTSLEKLITRKGRLPVDVTLAMGKQLCRALEVAHEAGVIHRDIKPQNMVVDAAGFLKVMDFGIARLAEEKSRGMKGTGLTQAGMVLGTPQYMSPEQLMGEELDARSDLYAAGAVLFECLTGEPVFVAPTVMALIAMHVEQEPRDPRSVNPGLPENLSRIVLKALHKRREQRWATASELYNALDQLR